MSIISNKNVITTISQRDKMFSRGDVERYMSVGQSALSIIEDTLRIQEKAISNIRNILDMPCGHGRVTRYLRAAFPHAEITGCDLNKDGVDFCKKTFDAKGVYSSNNFNQIKFDNKFDLIWVGSLITHFDVNQTEAFLDFITSYLKKEGICLCTSHGTFVEKRIMKMKYGLTDEAILKVLEGYFRSGYGYADYDGKNRYGISLISQNWFENYFKESKFKIMNWYSHKWDNHHDVMVIGHR